MTIRMTALLAALVLVSGQAVQAQGTKSDSVVKATAKADKADASGRQAVTITLTIDPKYHLYANPIDNKDLEEAQTVVTGSGKTKVVKVEYPAGEVKKDKVVGDYKIYKGKVTIKAVIERGGDAAELAIKVQACTATSCLQPGTLKVSVP
jgi:thiol:disulfide interchange protein